MLRLTRPWDAETSPESQWLAGFLDGEGCIRIQHQDLIKFGRNVGRGQLSFSQKPGVALAKAVKTCEKLGIRLRVVDTQSGNGSDVNVLEMRVDAAHSALEIVGRLQPVRLLENSRKIWIDRPFAGWHWPTEMATVIEVRPLGIGPVVSIGTTTKTFFAEGFASHNCSHDSDYDESLGFIPIRRQSNDINTFMWKMRCMKCSHFWGSNDPNKNSFCPHCFSLYVQGEKNAVINPGIQEEWESMTSEPVTDVFEPDYNLI
jgi:hypothetical protein